MSCGRVVPSYEKLIFSYFSATSFSHRSVYFYRLLLFTITLWYWRKQNEMPKLDLTKTWLRIELEISTWNYTVLTLYNFDLNTVQFRLEHCTILTWTLYNFDLNTVQFRLEHCTISTWTLYNFDLNTVQFRLEHCTISTWFVPFVEIGGNYTVGFSKINIYPQWRGFC